jgi:hypothetical protein
VAFRAEDEILLTDHGSLAGLRGGSRWIGVLYEYTAGKSEFVDFWVWCLSSMQILATTMNLNM